MKVFFLALSLLVLARPAAAQTELEQARASLDGVAGFYLSVNVEGPRLVTDQGALDVPTLHRQMAARLREAGLPVRADDGGVAVAARVPYLHVHVNTMEADRGQLPFAIRVRFYQSVRLAGGGAPFNAVTWEDGLVGLAYSNNPGFIAEVARDAIETFIEDFRRANS